MSALREGERPCAARLAACGPLGVGAVAPGPRAAGPCGPSSTVSLEDRVPELAPGPVSGPSREGRPFQCRVGGCREVRGEPPEAPVDLA